MTYVAIELGEPGARIAGRRGDVVVLIDALRASVTLTCALVAGARRVVPVLHVDEARTLAEREGYLCAGERGGARVPGFDLGNSPTEMLANRHRLCGQTLALTTSNGTRCVQAAVQTGAAAIVAGALPNAEAAVRAAWELANHSVGTPQGRGRNITLLAAGIQDEMTVEDSFTACWLLQALVELHGGAVEHATFEPVIPEAAAELFRTSEAGIRLTGLGYADDVAYCAKMDVLQVVPVFRPEVGFVEWAGSPVTQRVACRSGEETGHE